MNSVDWANGLPPDEVAPLLPKEDQLPSLHVKLRDSPHTARGYREIGMFYSCVPDSVYPWDPEIMKKIWEFAPDATPLWVHWVFRSPADDRDEIVVYGRHALGRHIKQNRGYLEPFRVLMPTMPVLGLKFEKPNAIWFIHEGPQESKQFVDLPGAYLPFDHTILDRALASAVGWRMSDKEYADHLRYELIEKPQEEQAKRREKMAEDLEYRQRDFERYAKKIMDSISDVEMKEYLATVGKRGRTRKPMVVLSNK
jgi:hypothetical protein